MQLIIPVTHAVMCKHSNVLSGNNMAVCRNNMALSGNNMPLSEAMKTLQNLTKKVAEIFG